MTQKFKVGDKVRVINPIHSVIYNGYNVGDVFKISDVFSESIETVDGPRLWHREVEKVPKKNKRISALEAQVAELTAKVEALEKVSKPKYTLNELLAQTPKSTNEQRKATIAEAKAFVADNKKDFYGERLYKIGVYMCEADFYVNKKKRVVTCVVKHISNGVIAKAIAKCAPDDVFNADIGKAIALGRALGLNVKRFEHAVKPTEVVVGMGVKSAFDNKIYRVVADYEVDGKVISVDFCIRHKLAITDDTDAQY